MGQGAIATYPLSRLIIGANSGGDSYVPVAVLAPHGPVWAWANRISSEPRTLGTAATHWPTPPGQSCQPPN